MNVLMLASEMTPFCKTGGLADVIGALPSALAPHGVDARVLLPHYSLLDLAGRTVQTLGTIHIRFDGQIISAEVQELLAPDSTVLPTRVYLLDCSRYYHRARLYGEPDDTLRFGFFCRAALEIVRQPQLLNWRPEIVHGHDWHAGLFPAYQRTTLEGGEVKMRTVFSIHNLAYQGAADKELLPRLGLDWSTFTPEGLEFYDSINPLKAGLVYSDVLTTVSPTYACEIQTPELGEGLDGVLRKRSSALHGILNGIDTEKWNPARDTYLAAPYSEEYSQNKALCKQALLRSCGIKGRDSAPLIGLVSRLSSQKGLDLVAEALPEMLEAGATFVLLGSGDARYMELFAQLATHYGSTASFHLGAFNEELAHQIYAGADFFLMPSLYEPCGLGQLIALAYGTIPIVRHTGGLADTVENWNSETCCGNGFVFEEFSARAMLRAIRSALETYNSPAWPRIVSNAFAARWTWDASAARYAALYQSTVKIDRTPL
jgi:starch synthase